MRKEVNAWKAADEVVSRNGEVQRRAVRGRRNQTIKTAERTEHTIKQSARSAGKNTVKSGAKGTVKASEKAIKTAEKTSKAAIKTAEKTAKATQKAAQAAAKAAQKATEMARQAAIAAYKAAVAAAKAIAAAIKAIAAAIKELIAAIAAGGWVAVVAIIVICLIGLIVASCFGIFFSSESTGTPDNTQTMQQVVQEINMDYQSELDSIKVNHTYDELEMSGSRAVWPEVLSIYAVKTTSDPDNPQEVAKFDDPMMFAQLERCAGAPTDTILFNIDSKSPINKDKTAILRVFAKVFYEYRGFYGDDLKVAKLEQFIYKSGKMDAFKAKFEEVNGEPWESVRDAFAFFEDDVVEVLMDTLGMSETAARNWFNGTETADMSIEQLVKEIKEYIDAKGKDFRLLFMIDEVGQYIGSDGSLMLNLQTIVEEIGSRCGGRVWVMVTSQEAIDSITKISGDDFSKIQGRFNTRLSLSSSSVDEVIKKRILAKNDINK